MVKKKKEKDIVLPFVEPETQFQKIYGKNYKTRPKDRFTIIRMINGLTNKHISEMNLKIKIPEEVYFSCNNCGKCCKNAKFRIPLYISDLSRWIDSNKKNFLRVLDHNRGHPKNTFFIITKEDFQNNMIELHGKFFSDYFKNINPSLEEINDENRSDCVFYDSVNKQCSIYNLRPIHCSIYPYNLILDIDFESLFSKAYRKLSGMQLKDKDYKNYLKIIKTEVALCPPEVLEMTPSNLKKLHIQKSTKRIKSMIISGLFSGSLYFKNRRDISEEVFTSLLSKEWK